MTGPGAGQTRNVPLDATLTLWPEEFPSPEQIAREQGEGEVYVMVYPPLSF